MSDLTLDQIQEVIFKAKRGAAALRWFSPEVSVRRSLDNINVQAAVTYGSSCNGAKEMNFYLKLVVESMADEIIERAVVVAGTDARMGQKIVETFRRVP